MLSNWPTNESLKSRHSEAITVDIGQLLCPPTKITLILSLDSTTTHSGICSTKRLSDFIVLLSGPSMIVMISLRRDLAFSFSCRVLPYWAIGYKTFFSFISSMALCSSKSSIISVAMACSMALNSASISAILVHILISFLLLCQFFLGQLVERILAGDKASDRQYRVPISSTTMTVLRVLSLTRWMFWLMLSSMIWVPYGYSAL